MKPFDQRRSPRIRQIFQVKFLKQGIDLTLDGKTANLSQKGAFIKTKHWRFLQAGDPQFSPFSCRPISPVKIK
jgi:hypothetical protein